MSEAAAPPLDPGSLLQSKSYRVLVMLASVLGVIVSVASWGFLELIHYTQHWVYKELPSDLGFGKVPMWWPLPVLAVLAAVPTFPAFPAMFLGIVGGLLASHLSGFAETPAVAALMGAATVSVLGLPLSSVILAMVVPQAGLSTAPLIIVAVAVAFITVRVLSARQESRAGKPAPTFGGDGKAEPASIAEPGRPSTVPQLRGMTG